MEMNFHTTYRIQFRKRDIRNGRNGCPWLWFTYKSFLRQCPLLRGLGKQYYLKMHFQLIFSVSAKRQVHVVYMLKTRA